MASCLKCGKEFKEEIGKNHSLCIACREAMIKMPLSADGLVKETSAPDMSRMVFDDKYSTKILLVRHGESLGNAKRMFLGHTDLDLSERGYIQAERTAEFLKDEKIDVIYSSSLIRAYNTAVPHAKIRALDILKSDEMREIFAGEWENRSVPELVEEYGDIFTIEWRQRFGTFCHLKSGESIPHLAERIYNEVERIARECVGKTVLIATHAAAIRSFWGKVTGTAPEDLNDALAFPQNASVSVVYFDGESLIPGEYSHAAHLADL